MGEINEFFGRQIPQYVVEYNGSIMDLFHQRITRKVEAMPMKTLDDLEQNDDIEVIVEGDVITVYIHGLEEVAVISAELSDTLPDVYEVKEVNAPDGWGPLLYDIVMEIASEYGMGLTSDKERGATSEARNVWDYYLDHRDDVDKEKIENYGEDYSSLGHVYRKELDYLPYIQG